MSISVSDSTQPNMNPMDGEGYRSMDGSNIDSKNRIELSVPAAPVTKERHLPRDLDRHVPNPGFPRSNEAVDREHPDGTTTPMLHPEMTVLQRHVAFFDRNGDGIITMWETFLSFRALGFNIIISLLAIPIIHLNFAYVTQDSWIPNPLLWIHVKNIHRAKHGSDSESYDTEGRFVPEKFEEVFSKYDRDNKGSLSLRELWDMTQANRNVLDPIGWFGSKFEFGVSFLLAAQQQGDTWVISKERLRRIFDGTIFYAIEEELNDAKRKQMHKGFTGGIRSGDLAGRMKLQ